MQKQKRTKTPNTDKTLSWKTFAKKVKPFLLENSQNHCSYCDIYFENRENSEIDHYKPKNQYPELEFEWVNLFAVCSICNKQKLRVFPENNTPIKPDDQNYNFFKYFDFEYETGKISISKGLSKSDYLRAKETIDFLGLNKGDKPNSRKRFLQNLDIKKELYPEVSYRYILECYQ